MLLGEPPRSPGELNFVLGGIPIRVHPMFWLIALLMGLGCRDQQGHVDPFVLVAWIVATFVSVLVHELGHALTMRAFGFSPWITLYGLGGMASYNPSQTNRGRGQGTLAQVLISLAGPATEIGVAVLVALALQLAGQPVRLDWRFPFVKMGDIGPAFTTYFLLFFFFVSVVWGLINLLPVYPLDGGQIAREVFLRINRQDGIRQSLTLSFVTAGTVAIIGLLRMNDYFLAMMFGYLAYSSYATWSAYNDRNSW